MLSFLPRILSWGRLLPTDWWNLGVASVTPVPRFCRSCWGQAFGEVAVGGVLSSSPALALLGGFASRLLAQPVLWKEPVFLT
jgi:hypothetical protein